MNELESLSADTIPYAAREEKVRPFLCPFRACKPAFYTHSHFGCIAIHGDFLETSSMPPSFTRPISGA